MKQGTWSVLFGCHSAFHSLLVIIAWKKLYGTFPAWWQLGCIFLHDIGHWGKDYLDDYEQKKQHTVLGARVARWLFGAKGYDIIMGHSLITGYPKSALHNPDKYSWVIAPELWMMSNTIFEPKLQRRGSTRRESAVMFKQAMRDNMANGFKTPAHKIYLEQW